MTDPLSENTLSGLAPARRQQRWSLPEHEDAEEPREALVSSLAGILALAPHEAEALLTRLKGDLIEELDHGDGASMRDAVTDAFERGLQLGLLVGFESSQAPGRTGSD
jgi:hypothetical protein